MRAIEYYVLCVYVYYVDVCMCERMCIHANII